jgi:nitrous oxidase accessory protein
MWYSQDVQVRDNLIERGRYGIHLMYCDRAVIEANHLVKNSVGVYTMYSNNVVLKQNDIRGHHGSSGYALGFKDADNLDVTNNVLVDNHAGAFIDGAPYTPMGYAHLFENIFAYNDIGVILQPAVNRAEFKDNVFWENAEQMAVSGSGQGKNVWLGNYWSDYTGFDADSDGQGDVPYVAERLFESLTDREPLLRALMYSPVSQAVEFAGAAFPIVRPQPKLTDTAPSIQPLSIPEFAVPAKGSPVAMFISALAVTAVGVWILWIAFGKVKMSV